MYVEYKQKLNPFSMKLWFPLELMVNEIYSVALSKKVRKRNSIYMYIDIVEGIYKVFIVIYRQRNSVQKIKL